MKEVNRRLYRARAALEREEARLLCSLARLGLITALTSLIVGDLETGKRELRRTIKGTIGFVALAEELGIPSKSLMRMLGPTGNPKSSNLFAVIALLQERYQIKLRIG